KPDDGPPLAIDPRVTVPASPPTLTVAFKLNVDKANGESMLYTPDGKKLITATDKLVRVWDAADGKPLRRLEGHTAGARGLSLLPGGRRVLSSSHDKTVRLWDIETGELLRTYEGATSGVTAVVALPNGRRFLTSATDGSVWLWDVDSGDVINQYPDLVQEIPVYGLAVTRDGKKAILGTWDSRPNRPTKGADVWTLPPTQLIVFEIETGKVLHKQNVPASVSQVHLSPDSRLAAVGTDKGIGVLDVDSKAFRQHGGLTARPTTVIFSRDG